MFEYLNYFRKENNKLKSNGIKVNDEMKHLTWNIFRDSKILDFNFFNFFIEFQISNISLK